MPVEIQKLCTCFRGWNCTTPPIHKVPYYRPCHTESTLRLLATWLTLSQVYPCYGATLITPLLKTRAVNIFHNIFITKVSMFWGQFINNSMHTNAQTMWFASVVCGAFASSLQSRVTFCRWLIKENRVFWLKLGVGPQNLYFTRASALGTGYFTGAAALGIGYLKFSAPEPTLAGTRLFKRVEPQFRFSIWNRVPAGTAQA